MVFIGYTQTTTPLLITTDQSRVDQSQQTEPPDQSEQSRPITAHWAADQSEQSRPIATD